MKKVLLAVITVVLCLSFSIGVLASGYAPSIERKDAPEAETEEEGGVSYAAEIVDNTGDVVEKVKTPFLILTGYNGRSTKPSNVSQATFDKIVQNLEQALDEIKDAITPAKLNSGIDAIAKQLNPNADSSLYSVTDVFDLSLSDSEGADAYIQKLNESGSAIVVTLNLGVDQDDPTPVIAIRNADSGSWTLVDPDNVDVKDDGKVQLTIEKFDPDSPNAFAVLKADTEKLEKLNEELEQKGTGTGDTANIGLWIGIVGVAVVLFVAIAVIKRKKED